MKDKGKGAIAVALLAGLGLWLWSRQADGEPPVFTCPHCGATFASQALLDAHIELEHPSVVYTCPHCGAEFATQAELYAHIATEHPSVIYTCPHCGAAFSSQAELDAHIETYHPAAEFNWLRPTGHIDPGNGWNDERLAYDGLTDTYAESKSVSPKSWSQPLEFTIAPTEVSAVRIWSRWRSSHTAIIEVLYNGTWHSIYEDSLPGYEWTERSIPGGSQIISQARVTYYNPTRTVSYTFRVSEFEFYGVGEPPEPPTPPPTTNLTGYVTDIITGVPIPGATGTVYQDKGTKTWAHDLVTNAAGYYEIISMIDDADQNLMVIYAYGYKPYSQENVSINRGDNQLDVQMVPA